MSDKAVLGAALAMGMMAQWQTKHSRVNATPPKKRVNQKRKATTAKNKAAKKQRMRNRK